MKLLPYSLTLFFILLASSATNARELNFATSSSSIVEKLSQPVRSKRRRTTRGASSYLKETRGLVRVKLVDPTSNSVNDNIIEEQAEVPIKQSQPHVNLKVEFDVNSYTIRSSSYAVLSELSHALQTPELEQQYFYINGHTDSDGDQNLNLKLSLMRAMSVKQYLTAQSKIAANRLIVVGYGEEMPLKENVNRFDKQFNRRVEIVVK
mgnify:CR=1 FL=1